MAGAGWGEVAGSLIGGFAEGYKAHRMSQAASSATGDAQNFAQFMANTTYRRAVRDLRLAGLNPALAYTQGGAPSPSVGAADVYGPEGLGELASRTVSNVQARQELNARLKIMKEDAKAAASKATTAGVEAEWSPRLAQAEWMARIAGFGNMNADSMLKAAQRDQTSTAGAILKKELPFAEMKARLGARGLSEFGKAERFLDSITSDPNKWGSSVRDSVNRMLRGAKKSVFPESGGATGHY